VADAQPEIRLVYSVDTTQLRASESILDSHRQKVDRIAESTARGKRATDEAIGAKRNYVMAVMGVGYALEDMNYGIQNAFNNFSMVAMALNAPAGVIIGTQLFAAAGLAVVRNWDALSRTLGISGMQFRSVASDVENLKKKVEELRKESEKDPAAFATLPGREAELIERERREQRRQAIVTADDPRQAGLGRAMSAVMAGEDMAGIAREIARERYKQGTVYQSAEQQRVQGEIRDRITDLQAQLPEFKGEQRTQVEREIQGLNNRLQEIRRAIFERAIQDAQNRLAGAMGGELGQIAELEGGDLPGIGRQDLATRMRMARREAQQARLKEMVGRAGGGALMGAIGGLRSFFSQGIGGLTTGEMAAGGAQFQANMEGAGATAEEQAAVMELFAGKAAGQRLSYVPFFVEFMQSNGATQREILQTLPEFIRAVESGKSPFEAAQGIVNRIARGGLAFENRLNKMSGRQRRQMESAAMGAQMLGIMPGINPEAISRLGGAADPELENRKVMLDQNKATEDLVEAMRLALQRGFPLFLRPRGNR
jgi:hypothetical protein